ncbi:hypothetical protein [Pseudomonas putida]|uniref:Uncharacterized protein n=1 Tax=Pseudomonas putida TaxID=303 RepID=A0A8I1JGL0_PSEPU|nr:hypothetical protein [Pseudomonas putida]MBI6882922.1 hypothetical protein [Pseudomonas putida]
MSNLEEPAWSESPGMPTAVETKIRMSLSEALMESLDVKLLSLGSGGGLLTPILVDWVKSSGGRHGGRLSAYLQDPGSSLSIAKHPKNQVNLLDESIKIQDVREILIIGSNVAVFDAGGQIFIQRTKEFIDSGNRIIRSLSRITTLIESKKK